MSMNAENIPTSTAFQDLLACGADAEVCKLALALGITETAGVDNQFRLDKNIEIAQTIREELIRRAKGSGSITLIVLNNLTEGT